LLQNSEFIMFTRACHLSKLTQYKGSHPCIDFSNDQVSSNLPTKTVCISLMHHISPTHLILLDLIALATSGEEYTLRSSSLYRFLQPPITSLFDPNILPKTSANAFSLWKCQVLSPNKTTGIILFVYVLVPHTLYLQKLYQLCTC
jgi:hypothetical protein